MLVSVIIPAYNAAKTIEKTIQSVLMQNYSTIEIIVVNDGSTDDTENVLKQFNDKIKYVYQKNAGVSAARNLGFNLAKGEFIQYLDSDDLLAEDKIKIQVEALLNNNADVAYGNWVKFKEYENTFQELEVVEKEMIADVAIELFTDFWVPPAAMLYTKQIAQKIGSWNLTLPIIQDARYALDAALAGAVFVYTPIRSAYYRISDNSSLSTKNKFAFVNDCFENAKQIDKMWNKSYINSPERKAAVIKVLRYCISEFSVLDKKKHTEAINYLLSVDPNYLPENSGVLRSLSKMFGYKNAERIARLKRRIS